MKFSKSHNPNKRKPRKPSRYSAERREEIRNEAARLIATAKSENERSAILDAYSITLNP